MFANLPSPTQVGSERSYGRLIGLTSLAYLLFWTVLLLFVADPLQPRWVLIGIFAPLAPVAIGVPVLLVLSVRAREN